MNDFNLPSANKYNLKEVYSKYEDGIRELILKNNLEIKELKINKGQFIIWSANLLHGGKKLETPVELEKVKLFIIILMAVINTITLFTQNLTSPNIKKEIWLSMKSFLELKSQAFF